MNGFLGTYMVSLDNKGRINCPSKYRTILERQDSSNLVICFMDGFLIVYPQAEWTAQEEMIKENSPFDEGRDKLRDFYSEAAECELKSGKILISAQHRKAAGLDKEVVLVGLSKTFEIWPPAKWEEWKSSKKEQ